jgi:hypothetical protein
VDTEPAPRVTDGDTEAHAVGTLASLSAFVQAATDAGRPTADGRDGLRALALVCAAHESMRSGGARVEVAELHAGTAQ